MVPPVARLTQSTWVIGLTIGSLETEGVTVAMFAEHCPRHDARVLLSPSRIEAIHNTPTGIVVTWRCWCGHVGRTDHRTVATPTPLRPAPMSEAC